MNAPEIEELVCRHLSVANASLVAMPDERLGERACVYIVAKKGAAAPDLGELRRHLDALGVAKFKWPERVEVRDELPLTNVQKVDKVRLRQEVAQLIAKERDDQSSGLSPSGGSR